MIKKLLFCSIIIFSAFQALAQNRVNQDSVVQIFGVVMTSDSLKAIPGASIIVVGKGRGTITNDQGVFSIAVLKGDLVKVSAIGYKDFTKEIPRDLEGREYSWIQLLTNDTAYLPAVVLKPRPTREQFERDFVNTRIPDDEYEIARQNTEEAKRRIIMAGLPADGKEAINYQLRQQANKYSYQGQIPPMQIFNPMAWAEFIKSWKRGDFKRK